MLSVLLIIFNLVFNKCLLIWLTANAEGICREPVYLLDCRLPATLSMSDVEIIARYHEASVVFQVYSIKLNPPPRRRNKMIKLSVENIAKIIL